MTPLIGAKRSQWFREKVFAGWFNFLWPPMPETLGCNEADDALDGLDAAPDHASA